MCLVVYDAPELETIYVASTGCARIVWGCGWSSAQYGWREISDGTREAVTFYGGEWGWLSRDELYEARQSWPRTAP